MWFEYKNDAIVAHIELGDPTPTCETVIEGIANSIDITFADLLNEGAPVALGNDYARYEFTAYVEGEPHEYGFGPYELRRLIRTTSVVVQPLDGRMFTPSERADLAYDLLEANVWGRFPTDESRELFLWADERLSKAVGEYVESLDGYDLDETEHYYEQAVGCARHLMELFESHEIPTISEHLMFNLMTDVREVA